MANRLSYELLENARSIRLLQIEDGYYGESLTCVISHHILEITPPFSALSYVWGDPKSTADIICNGISIEIGLNLGRALRWLRERKKELSPYFWVDALCINQEDLDERSSQVKIMGDIYSRAERVVSYIGEESSDLDDAWDVLKVLFGASVDASQSAERAQEVKQLFMSGYFKQIDPALTPIPPHDSLKWNALSNFWRREYFSRMWIIQEIVLAKEEPLVVCGPRLVRWKAIACSARFLYELGIVDSGKLATNFLNVCVLQDIRSATSNRELLYLLAATHRFRSGDPRDKVYALYGLASDVHGEPGNEASALFEPDYRISVTDMFTQLASQLMKRRYGLSVLAYAVNNPGRQAELPSWVPDWSASTNTDGEATKKLLNLSMGLEESGYKASLFPGQIAISGDRRRLHLRGTRVGVVRWASCPLEGEHFDMFPSFRKPLIFVDAWSKCMKQLGIMDDNYVSGGLVINAMWRTLIANRNRYRVAVTDDYYIHFLHFWKLTRIVDTAAVEYQRHHPRRCMTDKGVTTDLDDPGDITGWQNELEADAKGRYLFRLLSHRVGAVCTCGRKGSRYDSQAVDASSGRQNLEEDAIQGSFNQGTKPAMMSNSIASAVDDTCISCVAVHNITNGTSQLPVRKNDPTLAMIDQDPLLAEYYRRLREDEQEPIPIVEAEANSYASVIARVCGRLLFVTDGKLVGLGDPNVIDGDEVWLLPGTEMPFILRSTSSNHHLLVGEAYVHGIMDGSGVQNSAQSLATRSQIVI
ncbi:heterokaryon incompatibility protein-domain-containing protein, partial [Paraphoma chrysanthemicola]